MTRGGMVTSQHFFAAIKAGSQSEVIQQLELDPALVNARDENGLSAVLTAAYYQEPAIARMLVERGAALTIFEACSVGDVARVQAALEGQPELVNEYAPDGFQPLGLAAFFGHTEF